MSLRRHEPVNRTAGGAIWRRGRRVIATSPRHRKPSSALADDTQAGGAVWRTRTRAARNVTGVHRQHTQWCSDQWFGHDHWAKRSREMLVHDQSRRAFRQRPPITDRSVRTRAARAGYHDAAPAARSSEHGRQTVEP